MHADTDARRFLDGTTHASTSIGGGVFVSAVAGSTGSTGA
jgi:hypothetical protein